MAVEVTTYQIIFATYAVLIVMGISLGLWTFGPLLSSFISLTHINWAKPRNVILGSIMHLINIAVVLVALTHNCASEMSYYRNNCI
ncbi:hypothetical protein F4859DRAFT_381354 [Xylaria cf. heliscus]|nr:hypothetical protein F4859DRAFT_381354 [Xylaria cf. heliscus]